MSSTYVGEQETSLCTGNLIWAARTECAQRQTRLQPAGCQRFSLLSYTLGGLQEITNHRVCIMHLLPWLKIFSRLKKFIVSHVEVDQLI